MSELEEVFSNSDLHFTIDLVDWHRISTEFQQHIQQQAVEFP